MHKLRNGQKHKNKKNAPTKTHTWNWLFFTILGTATCDVNDPYPFTLNNFWAPAE